MSPSSHPITEPGSAAAEPTPPPSSPEPQAPPSDAEWVRVEWIGVKPVLVYIILALTVVVFLLQQVSWFFFGTDIPASWGAKVNEAILQGQFWRLLTPVLLHGSVLHLGFNMYALHAIGRGLESYYGRARFIGLYLLAAVAGNALSFAFSPYPSLGSSTAIFGLLGAEGVLLYQNRAWFGDRARRALSNVVMIAAVNLFIGLSPGIDNWGHLGGLLGGSAFAWFAGPWLHVQGQYPRLILADRRAREEVLRAGLLVGVVIVLIVAWVAFRSR